MSLTQKLICLGLFIPLMVFLQQIGIPALFRSTGYSGCIATFIALFGIGLLIHRRETGRWRFW